MFVIASAISVLGRVHPLLAGSLLIAATAVPMLMTQLAMDAPLFSLDTALANIGSRYVMMAFLYLIAASIGGAGGGPAAWEIQTPAPIATTPP